MIVISTQKCTKCIALTALLFDSAVFLCVCVQLPSIADADDCDQQRNATGYKPNRTARTTRLDHTMRPLEPT